MNTLQTFTAFIRGGLRRFAITSTALAIAFAGCAPAIMNSTVHAADCTISDKLVNSCRPWLGAASNNYGVKSLRDRIANHESRIGRQVDMPHDYVMPGELLSEDNIYLATRPNTVALINWQPVDSWADAGGSNASVNDYIDAMGRNIQQLGSTKIMLTIAHEPEDNVSPGGDPNCTTLKYKGTSGSVADYVNMWHNVRARFDALGVKNVVWSMNFMGYSGWDCLKNDLYPGDAYVDWVLFDKYGKTSSFTDAVGEFYNFLTVNSNPQHDYLSKPWGLAEWGYSGTIQTDSYAFYDDAKRALDNNTFPKLKAYVVWDSSNIQTQYSATGVLDQTEQDHYNAFANDPIFGFGSPAAVNTPDTVAPSVSWTDAGNPADGSTVSGTVALGGSATDSPSATSLLVDNQVVSTAAPGSNGAITYEWDTSTVSDGDHTLQISATDAAGNTGTSTILHVTIQNAAAQPSALSAPSGLTAVLAGKPATTANLSWTAASGSTVSGYNVYRDSQRIASVAGSQMTYQDTNLADATTYSYSITSLDAAGTESTPSTAALVTTGDTTAPTTPTTTATLASQTSASITWTAANDNVGVTGYRIYRNGSLLTSVDAATNTYNDANLADATTYTYSVAALDAAGNESTASRAASVNTPDQTAPSTPTDISTVSGSQSVSLSWTAANDNVGVTGYKVYRNGALLTSVSGSTTAYVNSGLSPQTSYQYYVVATDAAGNVSAGGNTVTAAALDVTAPSTPTNLTGSLSGTSVVLNWTASTDDVGVKSYNVFRSGTYIGFSTTATFSDTSAPQGKSSSYFVKAHDTAGNVSTSSNTFSITVPDKTAPTAPSSFTATAGSRKITLNWKAATDNVAVTGYYLYRGTTKIATLSASSLTYTNSSLTTNTSYTYKLVAYDAAGNQSAGVSVTARAK